jgi:hypothetical protein
MFKRIINFIKLLGKKRVNYHQPTLTDEKKMEQEFYVNIKKIYVFIKWLNTKGFISRRERKSFWKDVMAGQPVIEKLLQDILQRYELKEKTDGQK